MISSFKRVGIVLLLLILAALVLILCQEGILEVDSLPRSNRWGAGATDPGYQLFLPPVLKHFPAWKRLDTTGGFHGLPVQNLRGGQG